MNTKLLKIYRRNIKKTKMDLTELVKRYNPENRLQRKLDSYRSANPELYAQKENVISDACRLSNIGREEIPELIAQDYLFNRTSREDLLSLFETLVGASIIGSWIIVPSIAKEFNCPPYIVGIGLIGLAFTGMGCLTYRSKFSPRFQKIKKHAQKIKSGMQVRNEDLG
ncbi:MAG: hypothetical protein AABW79_01510 [Nanoarchaeota archaeon]